MSSSWLALAIGNSRLHWALFSDLAIKHRWHTCHNTLPTLEPLEQAAWEQATALWIVSVVPGQSQYWQTYFSQERSRQVRLLQLEDVPLTQLYPSLGVDRAVAAWGAVQRLGCPVLVVDAGTALTLTGVDGDRALVGGAILPGMRLQHVALHQGTAALPNLAEANTQAGTEAQSAPEMVAMTGLGLPPRWARTTATAIASGIVYSLLASLQAYVEDWWQQFPGSAVVLTGGDGDRLYRYLRQTNPDLALQITPDPDLIFHGIKALKTEGIRNPKDSGTEAKKSNPSAQR
jgi:type III pantothenate kinase